MMTGSEIQDLPKFTLVYLICGSLLISGVLMVSAGGLKVSQADALEMDNKITTSVKTLSSFITKIVEEKEKIPYETEYIDDSEKDKCSENEKIQVGVNGVLTKIIEITYYEDEEYGRKQIESRRVEPISEKIVRGTKTINKTLKTAEGDVTYTCNLGKFRATAYDKNCRGCNETTAIGLKAGFGVVAVDPKVIPLGTRLYITGYGMAVAGDTGGAIKGKKIDLGFDKIDKSWGVRNAEVYVL